MSQYFPEHVYQPNYNSRLSYEVGRAKKLENASNRIRTDDLYITSVAPYQLGHRSFLYHL